MKNETMHCKRGADQGFTIMEFVFVMLIISMMTAMAVPSFMQWRRSIDYRTAARGISLQLRDARTKAITHNLQYAVELDVANSRYRTRIGNQIANSSWADLAACPPDTDQGKGLWQKFPANVTMDAQGTTYIWFNPNGSASANVTPALSDNAVAQVNVKDAGGVKKHAINVYPIGQIKVD